MPSPLDPVLAGVYRRGYQIRHRRRAVRVAGAVLAVQLVVAVPLAFSASGPPQPRTLHVVADPTATTTTAAPETTTEAPPPSTTTTSARPRPTTTTTIGTGSVYGTIAVGGDVIGKADLTDDAGRTWHQDADRSGAYRFDGLHAGHYQLTASVESPPSCGTDGCIAAMAMSSPRDVTVVARQAVREDFDLSGPTTPPTTSTTTSTTVLH